MIEDVKTFATELQINRSVSFVFLIDREVCVDKFGPVTALRALDCLGDTWAGQGPGS